MDYKVYHLTFLQKFFLKIIKCGRIPKHVAFIMDGNRRFARSNKIDIKSGHKLGRDTFWKILNICELIGIKEITVYCFSIENFKRSQEEVGDIMDVLKSFMKTILNEQTDIKQRGICLKFCGNLSLVPLDLRKMIAKVVDITKNNVRIMVVNMAICYTSRDEITTAIKDIVQGVRNGEINKEDIDENLITQCLYVKSEPDMIIRTSSEVRFSDFLLWQIRSSYVCFVDTLWPEYDELGLMWCVFKYQVNYDETRNEKEQVDFNGQVEEFLAKLKRKRLDELALFI